VLLIGRNQRTFLLVDFGPVGIVTLQLAFDLVNLIFQPFSHPFYPGIGEDLRNGGPLLGFELQDLDNQIFEFLAKMYA